ncbi:MFS transporter [Actinomadura sp. WMMB 499]|uniref:MFS transporter n=1 Tax=Actinomadura sp. WMMB 499 TaxID=1219491 RepID=UPI0012477ED6|nr:MFS transporter [Actinomadura sp. WMMB 499]QFG22422.1 MFS transporter [Actinomadura sp. WMMB 499]
METETSREPRGNPWAILFTLALGFFMTLLDLTIVNIAIPDMTDDLGASLDDVLWVVNAYTLTLAVLMITAGRLGDLRGKRNLFILGVAVFTLASAACGLAQDPGQLIAFRALQGVGAAMLMPQTLSIIADVFPADRRGAALGVWGAVAGISGACGPVLGGVLVNELDWRWIFYVNLPLGGLTLVLAWFVLPREQKTVRHRLDMPGVLLATASLFCLTFALTEGERNDWNGWTWALIGISVMLFVIFLVYERGRQDGEPLVPFSLFRDRNFTIMNFVGIAVSFGLIGVLLPLTIYLQSVLGYSALESGLALLPLALGSFVMAGPAGALSDRIGGKYILMAGVTAFGGGLVWILATAEPGNSWTTLAGPLFLIGMGAGCTFAPMATEVMRNVPPRLTGAASGVNNALRQVGSVLAGAIIGAVLQNRLASALDEQARERARALPGPYRDPFVEGFSGDALQVGAEAALPAGVPQDVARRLQDAAARVFEHGFVDAMAPTMGVSAGVMFLATAACLAVRRHRGPAAAAHGLPAPEPVPAER